MQLEQWDALVGEALGGRLSEVGAFNELRVLMGLPRICKITRNSIEDVTQKVKELQNAKKTRIQKLFMGNNSN